MASSTMQWTGDNWEEIILFVGDHGTVGPEPGWPTIAQVVTIDGVIDLQPGDRIARDERGKFSNLGMP